MVAIKLQFGEDIRRVVLEDQLPVAAQFAALTARVIELYPELQGGLRLTWRDEEGDAISVTTASDFQEALTAHRRGEATALRLIATRLAPSSAAPTPAPATPSRATPQPQPQPAYPARPAPPAQPENDDEDDNSADEAERDQGPAIFNERGQRVHPYITCDGCQGAVAGIRYKCAECHDFDLCETCEAKEAHPRHHVLLKIRVPQRVQVWTPYSRHHGGFHGGRGAFRAGGGCWGGRERSWQQRGGPWQRCGPNWAYAAAPTAAPAAAPAPAPAPAPSYYPAPAAPAPETPNFDAQLRILHEMGFVDDNVNLQLLQGRRGRLEDVISRLTQLNVNTAASPPF